MKPVCVLITQLCPTLCDPMDCSPPGSSVHGILQARILVWMAIPFSRDLPNPGIEPRSPALQILCRLSHQGSLNEVYFLQTGKSLGWETQKDLCPGAPQGPTQLQTKALGLLLAQKRSWDSASLQTRESPEEQMKQ